MMVTQVQACSSQVVTLKADLVRLWGLLFLKECAQDQPTLEVGF